MTHRVPPSERISKQLFDALNGSTEAEDLTNEIMRRWHLRSMAISSP